MKASIGFACALLAASAAFAHPGGLNAEGCHNNRKTGDYHCHGGKAAGTKAGAPSAGPTSRAQRADKPAANAGGQTCYTGPRGGTYTITKSGRKNYGGC